MVELPAQYDATNFRYYVAGVDLVLNRYLWETMRRVVPSVLAPARLPLQLGYIARHVRTRVDQLHPGGVYSMVFCRRERLRPGSASGWVILKFGQTGSIPDRLAQLVAEFHEFAHFTLLWYFPVDGD